MSTYDDSLLAARFAALAPEPLAGDWDDVLDRAGAARNGRRARRSRGPGRRRLLVVLAAVALAAVVTPLAGRSCATSSSTRASSACLR